MKSRFGLHIRLHNSLFDAVAKCQRLEQRSFQTVLMLQTKKFLNMSDDDVKKFIAFRRQYFDQIFVHGAYWSNLTQIEGRGFYSLIKEIELAEKLEFTNIVIHPGSFNQHLDSQERVDYIIKALEIILSKSLHITILLENSPHKDRSFSSDIAEFGLLFSQLTERLSDTSRIKMCVDTAHAYAAGYDISTPKKVDAFVDYLITTVGKKNIGLLHCNDTKKACGYYVDEHAVPGYGNIGMQSLYHFVHHKQLSHLPVILEMPCLDESLEYDILQQFIAMETIRL